jgi:hypothetical protein
MEQDLKAILGDKGTEETQTGRGKAHGFFPVFSIFLKRKNHLIPFFRISGRML